MKLVSVNAILIGSCNISLFVKVYKEYDLLPPITLFILSFIYINLLLLLEYQHRQFSKAQIDISQTNSLFRRYLYLFGVGVCLTLLHKIQLQQYDSYFVNYVLLGSNIYYSMLYYFSNLGLGISYLYLYKSAYVRANKERLPFEMAKQQIQTCSICLRNIVEGQKIAKISCMHLFHSICLNRWIKKRMNCPLCLAPISQF